MKLSRPRAVYEFCLMCVGNSPKEVTLCEDFNCPLWPYRFGAGCSFGSKEFDRRMETAKRNYPEEFAQARKDLEGRGYNPKDDSTFYKGIRNKEIQRYIKRLFGLKP